MFPKAMWPVCYKNESAAVNFRFIFKFKQIKNPVYINFRPQIHMYVYKFLWDFLPNLRNFAQLELILNYRELQRQLCKNLQLNK
jgi:hypothetical protein